MMGIILMNMARRRINATLPFTGDQIGPAEFLALVRVAQLYSRFLRISSW